MFKDPSNQLPLIHGIDILIELFGRANLAIDDQRNGAFEYPPEFTNMDPLLNSVAKRIPQLVSYLNNTRQSKMIETTAGMMLPLRAERLKILRLFEQILKMKSQMINQIFIKEKLFTISLNLFFEFHLNNFLHSVIRDMFKSVFDCDIKHSKDLLIDIFNVTKITERFVDGQKLNDCAV
jgi:hypothetical protein